MRKLLSLVLIVLGVAPGVEAQVRPGVRAARQIAEAERRAEAQIERLRRMTPDQRERVLSLMAPERRRRVEARLAELERMNDGERARLGKRLQLFRELPDEDQQELRGLAQQLNDMDPPRLRVVRAALLRLRALSDEERRARLDSNAFRRQFSSEERIMLEKLGALALPEE